MLMLLSIFFQVIMMKEATFFIDDQVSRLLAYLSSRILLSADLKEKMSLLKCA